MLRHRRKGDDLMPLARLKRLQRPDHRGAPLGWDLSALAVLPAVLPDGNAQESTGRDERPRESLLTGGGINTRRHQMDGPARRR